MEDDAELLLERVEEEMAEEYSEEEDGYSFIYLKSTYRVIQKECEK